MILGFQNVLSITKEKINENLVKVQDKNNVYSEKNIETEDMELFHRNGDRNWKNLCLSKNDS